MTMLAQLTQQPPDALLALIKLYSADDRADKIDLGVGVYRTGQGDTPVFTSIKKAERILVDQQDSKAYLGPEGDMGFVEALKPIIFGSDFSKIDCIDGMQTPGGTGGVRLAAALSKAAGVKRIWMGTPSWPNHAQIMKDLGVEVGTFNHASDDGTADMAALREAIASAAPTDAIQQKADLALRRDRREHHQRQQNADADRQRHQQKVDQSVVRSTGHRLFAALVAGNSGLDAHV